LNVLTTEHLYTCGEEASGETVAPHYSGRLQAIFDWRHACPGVAEIAVLDETAETITSACPSGDVEVIVIKPSKTFRIAPESVHVHRRGDGTPALISGQIAQ